MKWIKATDKYPSDSGWRLARISETSVSFPAVFATNVICSVGGSTFDRDLIEWLDESEPVFTIEDMKSAWEDGKFEGVRDYQMNDGNTFEDFMKEKYNIDIKQ